MKILNQFILIVGFSYGFNFSYKNAVDVRRFWYPLKRLMQLFTTTICNNFYFTD